MANYLPKDRARMGALGRLGGVSSGEIGTLAVEPDENDWRCPSCHHFNSEKRRGCAKCNAFAPANGRLTRKALSGPRNIALKRLRVGMDSNQLF